MSVPSCHRVHERVAWDESIDFPVGLEVKKTYMAHTRAYPKQLYGKGKHSNVCQVRRLNDQRRVKNLAVGHAQVAFDSCRRVDVLRREIPPVLF